MAINDAAGMGANGARGHAPQRPGRGSQPCTTAQTTAWPAQAWAPPSADATPHLKGPDGLTISEDPASALDLQPSGGQAEVSDGGAIGVFVLSEHDLVRQGLVDLLSTAPDLLVVGAAGSAGDSLPLVAASEPRVVLLDASLPDCGGIDLSRQLSARNPGARCILLTFFDDDEALVTAVMAGAAGYLVKQVGGDQLLDGIRAVAAGGSLLDARVIGRLLDRLGRAGLDDREQRLLELIRGGRTDAQIAEELGRGEGVVRDHVAALCGKLALRRRRPEVGSRGPGFR